MMRKRFLILCVMSAIPFLSMNAQTASFLNLPDDARDMATGGIKAVGDAARAIDTTVVDASVSYFSWSPKGVGSNIIDADVSYRFNKIAILAQARFNTYGSYPMSDASGVVTGSYKPLEQSIGLGAAYSITDGLAVSVLAKYVGSGLAPEAKASAFCADVNVVYAVKSLKVGLLAANLGTKLNYSSSSAPLPMLIKAGVQNDFAFGEKFGLQIGLGAGYLAQSPNKAVVVDAGADFRMFDMFSLRAGYHYSTDVKAAPSYMSAGLGFDISMISLSAAYLIASGPVSGTLCATIGVRF